MSRRRKRGSLFNTTPQSSIRKSLFDLSYSNTLTTEMARLTPIMCQEVLPGDTMKLDDVVLTRFLPMLSPVMGRIDCTIRYFFVPARLCWDHFMDFIYGGSDGTLEPSKICLNLADLDNVAKTGVKSLYDYLGHGDCKSGEHLDEVEIDLMPFVAYNLIYNEYYRDPNLSADQTDLIDIIRAAEGKIATDDNLDGEGTTLLSSGFLNVKNKCWQKDYFTSALPWAQRGPQVTIPIGNTAPVSINPFSAQFGTSSNPILPFKHTPFVGTLDYSIVTQGDGVTNAAPFYANLVAEETRIDGINGVLGKMPGVGQSGVQPITGIADLSSVSGITINDLRLLARVQRWREMNAVGGGRPVEQNISHWDEIIPDYTIQRPQYLGGAKFPVQISEVLQTALSATSGSTSATAAGVGQMYGHGIGVSGKPGFKQHHFCEYGWIIGLMSFMPHVSYFQGIPRKFTRFDKFDYAWNELAHLGEQEVLQKEINVNSDTPDKTFGYQSRYAEYKYNPDEIHGDFRDTLLYWTLARNFANDPNLNESFVTASAINRIFAVTGSSYDHILVHMYHNLKCSRKLPKYGMPGIHIV